MEPAPAEAATPSTPRNVNQPELAKLLPVLYPGDTFQNLAAYSKPRADLNAILLTGIPKGIIDGFQNYTGPVEADMLRLNTAIPPSENPRPLGLVGPDDPDPAGFPNGRRVVDDVTTMELRAIAGADDPAGRPVVHRGRRRQGDHGRHRQPRQLQRRLPDAFPYLATPNSGYQTKPGKSSPSATREPRWPPTPRTRRPARGRCCWTSAATSARWSSRHPPRWSASRWRSGRCAAGGVPSTPPRGHLAPRRGGAPPHTGRGGAVAGVRDLTAGRYQLCRRAPTTSS